MGTHANACFYLKILHFLNFKLKSNEMLVLVEVGSFWNPIPFLKNHLMAGNDSDMVIFSFCKVQASVTCCTYSIQVTSD